MAYASLQRMADPIGIAGTAAGIVSLCFQIYGSLRTYLDDVRDGDSYVLQVITYLSRLYDLVKIFESAIPSFQNEHSTPSQTVILCLQDCEAQLKILDIEVQKYRPIPTSNLKGKFIETKRRLKFPFSRPELEKMACQLDRINSLLSLALQGLDLHIQSSNLEMLTELEHSNRASTAELAIIHNEVNEVRSQGSSLKTKLKGNQDSLATISHNIQSCAQRITQIQTDTSSSVTLLHELIASHELSKSKLEEMIAEIGIIVQVNQASPGERLFQMLTSKPDFLRSCQDDLATIYAGPPGNTQELGLSSVKYRPKRIAASCGCRFRRQITRQSSTWRFLTRFDETILSLYHEPGCPCFRNSHIEKQYTTGIIFNGLHQILNVAIEASFMRKTGAGGVSISPVFRYFAMVDESKSPAFGIMFTMRRAFSKAHRCAGTNDDYQKIVHFGISKLRRVFTSGSSSPTDVNQHGQTLIDEAFSRDMPPDIIFAAVRELLWMNVPCMITASLAVKQSMPGIMEHCLWLTNSDYDVDYVKDTLIPLLIQHQPDNCICKPFLSLPYYLSTSNSRHCITEIKGMDEVFGLDRPLFRALLRKDEALLIRVLPTLASSPNSFESSNISALHIAVFWPKGLKIILHSHLNIDLDKKFHGFTPLCLAIESSQQICREKGDRMCEDCPCAESTKLLLDSGCRLPHNPLFRSSMRKASLNVVHTLLSHVKLWRQILIQLAEKELLVGERQRIGLYDSFVLDHSAPRAIQKLESRGVIPSKEFRLSQDDYRLSSSGSIYHDISDTRHAEIAFELGFRDIDTFYKGATPIMGSDQPLDICEWFIAHGANTAHLMPLYQQCPSPYDEEGGLPRTNHKAPNNSEPPLHTVSHHLMRRIGKVSAVELWESNFQTALPRSMLNIVRTCSLEEVGDGCECSCSNENGCLPIKSLLSELFSVLRNKPLYTSLDSILCVMDALEVINTYHPHITNAIIRVLTFEALEIRHTCCETIPDDFDGETAEEFFASYGNDFLDIRDEDESLLGELESLVAEFLAQFHSQEQILSEFLNSHWKDRMEQVREQKRARRLSREEKESVEELGVRLIEEDPEGTDTSEVPSISEIMDDYVRELDDIYR